MRSSCTGRTRKLSKKLLKRCSLKTCFTLKTLTSTSAMRKWITQSFQSLLPKRRSTQATITLPRLTDSTVRRFLKREDAARKRWMSLIAYILKWKKSRLKSAKDRAAWSRNLISSERNWRTRRRSPKVSLKVRIRFLKASRARCRRRRKWSTTQWSVQFSAESELESKRKFAETSKTYIT